MAVAPSASYSLTVRLEIKNHPGKPGRVAPAVADGLASARKRRRREASTGS